MSADYWSLTFDANGNILNQDAAALVSEIVASATSNLFVLSHGWGNTQQDATNLYDTMFPLVRADPGCPADARFLGIFWPSIWFPDPPPADQAAVATAVAAGAPGAADAAVTGAAIAASVAPSMPTDAAKALKQMGALIDTGLAQVAAGTGTAAAHTEALGKFHALLGTVFRDPGVAMEDGGESPLLTSVDPKTAYQQLAQTMGSAPSAGDVEGLGDIFGKVWNGAKDALRIGSYFQMKARAGDVGQKGLGPFLEQLLAASPNIRVHLVGHSFGARLVSFALAGTSSADASPIASLTLVQGAFSHWAFTQRADNPFAEAGALSTFADRVHGPLVATWTLADWAVGNWYPKASFLSQQDAQGEEASGRWDGMGKDGFRGVTPSGDLTLPLALPPTLAAGTFYRADANTVICDTSQSSFAGAHSDILHPEVAALIVAAATAAR